MKSNSPSCYLSTSHNDLFGIKLFPLEKSPTNIFIEREKVIPVDLDVVKSELIFESSKG